MATYKCHNQSYYNICYAVDIMHGSIWLSLALHLCRGKIGKAVGCGNTFDATPTRLSQISV
jgi:hypothetical protein